ncbi:MAG: outer membrane lipoprotein-sorting protein [Gammaproteobacteria bacterium]
MKRLLLPFLLLLNALPLPAAEIPAVVRDCMERNLPQTSSMQSIELRARDRSGYEQVLQADVYWKRFTDGNARVLMYFSEPADIRGARFLIIQNEPQNDMYIYMPGLFKVRKITSRKISSSVLGTDFSYEDFERLHGILTDLQAEQFPDDRLSGRPVYVVNSYPGGDSGYEKISTLIDKETCVALQVDLYEQGHKLRKRMTVDPAGIRSVGGIHVPGDLLMQDLRDKTETRLVINNIRTEVNLEDDLFDPDQLRKKDAPPVISD